MTARILFFFSLLIIGFSESLLAQKYKSFNEIGQLVEEFKTYPSGELKSRAIYHQGRLVRTEKLTLTDEKLTRRVSTTMADPPFDIIEEWTYDGDILVNKLYGNNRTGRWSSEGYIYDAHGNLTQINHYRKNGVLAYQTINTLAYDDRFRVTEKCSQKIVLPSDSLHADWENEVAIGVHQVPPEGEYGSLKTRSTYTYDQKDRVTETSEFDYKNQLKLLTTYTYSPSGKTETTTFYKDNGSVDFEEKTVYDQKGNVVQVKQGHLLTKTIYFPNGIPRQKTTSQAGKRISRIKTIREIYPSKA